MIYTAGPGHTLNELINRLVSIYYNEYDYIKPMWQLYPGPYGLYARHSDGWVFGHNNLNIERFYNQHIRYQLKEDRLAEFKEMTNGKKLPLYFNTTDPNKILEYYPDDIFLTACIDLTQSSTRHHHLLMEFSIGAADSQDYAQAIDTPRLIKRLIKKNNSEVALMSELNDRFSVIDIGKLLNKDFSQLIEAMRPEVDLFVGKHNLIDTWEKEIDDYNFINQCSHPELQDIANMSWNEILAF